LRSAFSCVRTVEKQKARLLRLAVYCTAVCAMPHVLHLCCTCVASVLHVCYMVLTVALKDKFVARKRKQCVVENIGDILVDSVHSLFFSFVIS